MKQTISRILRQYAAPVELERQGVRSTVQAFLRPVTGKSWQSMHRIIDELGELPQGQYLLLGPGDCRLDTAEAVFAGGVRYLVRRAERLLVGREAVCTWGLLEKGGPDDAGAT